jgi:hypothetical protein
MGPWGKSFAMVFKLWPELASVKVRPLQQTPTGPLPTSVTVKAARGEGVALQGVLWSDTDVPAVHPSLTIFAGQGTAVLPADAVRLYRVDFIDIQKPSDGPNDPLGGKGEWPDPLIPVGTLGQPRNGAPFALSTGWWTRFGS